MWCAAWSWSEDWDLKSCRRWQGPTAGGVLTTWAADIPQCIWIFDHQSRIFKYEPFQHISWRHRHDSNLACLPSTLKAAWPWWAGVPRLPEQPLQNQGSGEPKGMRILVMKMVTMIMSKRCKNTGPGSLRTWWLLWWRWWRWLWASDAKTRVQGAWTYDEGNGHNDENGDRDHVRGNIFVTLGTLKKVTWLKVSILKNVPFNWGPDESKSW